MTSNESMHEKSKIAQGIISEFDEKVIKKAEEKRLKKNLKMPSEYSKKVKFCILLDEIIQYKRPRANFRMKRIYDPPESSEFKNIIFNEIQKKIDSSGFKMVPDKKPIRIVMNMYINPPKGTSKIDMYLMEKGYIRPSVRPDVDNYMKNILDGMNNILMEDDGQVISYSGDKFYSSVCRIEFILSYDESEVENAIT